jgi:hypothetical protein
LALTARHRPFTTESFMPTWDMFLSIQHPGCAGPPHRLAVAVQFAETCPASADNHDWIHVPIPAVLQPALVAWWCLLVGAAPMGLFKSPVKAIPMKPPMTGLTKSNYY